MDILGYLSAALGGGLFTALVFVFAQSNTIASMRTEVKGLVVAFNNHVVTPPTCTFHQQIASGAEVTKTEIDNLKDRLGRLESWRQGKA